jgi:hypothetical protein
MRKVSIVLRDCYEYDGVVLARATAQIGQAMQMLAYRENAGKKSTVTHQSTARLPSIAIAALNSLLVDIWGADEQV